MLTRLSIPDRPIITEPHVSMAVLVLLSMMVAHAVDCALHHAVLLYPGILDYKYKYFPSIYNYDHALCHMTPLLICLPSPSSSPNSGHCLSRLVIHYRTRTYAFA
jgi:hypothetical protein